MGANEQGANVTSGRWLTIPRTLCFIFNGDDVLLMKRSPHRRVFPNCYNGVGGHIERDEDPYTGALREIREETNLDVKNLRLRAIHNIDAGHETGILLFVFTAEATSREFRHEGDEGTLHWIARRKILDLELVEDLPYILPRIFAMPDNAPPYFAHVSYDANDQIQISFQGG
ncbi:MAG: NUDIX domain-containing protein [Chloroflexi bacterium]|nr:MAG: NUDIX domain-containing protein [Chloroflexota bacterium]